ncbi:MAG: carbohydrate kinase [Candidatus Micrarchaeota archaeon]
MILTMGEVLIDFIGKGDLSGCNGFEKCFGGAPANVARGLAKLGSEVGMLGMVSDDGFGKFLYDTLKESAVDVRGIVVSKKRKTRLAFVSVKGDGERDFAFYSEKCADEGFGPEDIDAGYVGGARVLHFGSIGMISETGERATMKAVGIVKKAGGRISYDPNLRPMLWDSEDEMLDTARKGLGVADILKVDGDELKAITGEDGLEQGVEKLPKMELVCVTLGRGGCYYYHKGELERIDACPVKAADSTGAGDAFMAGLLFGITNDYGVERSVGFANAAGAVSTLKRFPSLKTVNEFMDR